ncbi:MAG: lysophospholipid acyltransferase family protein [Anaerolineales bacterium]|jgi:1-acyl-sn-glycerol-3-phosphate acyltransferase
MLNDWSETITPSPPPEMPDAYQLPVLTRVLRAIFRPLFRLVFRALSQVTIQGRQNIPAYGAYLIAINHVSLYEAPFILAFWPHAPEAVGAADVWNRPGQSMLARLYGGIPLNRGQYDRQVMDTMLTVLKAGRPLLLAPEGRRSHEPGMRRGLPGLAFVIDQAAVPVVPVGISGATDDFLAQALRGKRPAISMHIGEPIRLPAITGKGAQRRAARQRNVDLVMLQIAELLPEEYRGVYANSKFSAAETS